MSCKIDDGGPAFPATDANHEFAGMSLRDWFAGQVLASGFLDRQRDRGNQQLSIQERAKKAYLLADAMLAERAKKDGET